MHQTVTKDTFIHAFARMERNDNFSYAAREAMFEYFERWEDETGESLEFDVIAICCDYTEATPAEFSTMYDLGIEYPADADDYDEVNQAVYDALSKHTETLGIVGDMSSATCTFVIRNF